VLFRGNSALAAQAKRASDGFEHGFLDFGAVRSLAEQARDETARLLRRAILECADVPSEHTEKLLSPPFDVPLHSFVTRYIWGTILGEGTTKHRRIRSIQALNGERGSVRTSETKTARSHSLRRKRRQCGSRRASHSGRDDTKPGAPKGFGESSSPMLQTMTPLGRRRDGRLRRKVTDRAVAVARPRTPAVS
jgi:hypothetical protein